MRTTRVKTLIVAPMIGVGLFFGTAACGNPVQSTPTEDTEFEFEDCDAEDRLEGDSDCKPAKTAVKKKDKKKKSLFGTNKGGSKKNSGFGGGSSRKSGGKRG